MRATAQGIKLIKHYEKCVLHPYLCPAGVPTIGWGNTFYENGKKVTLKDKPITQQRADQLFEAVLSMFEKDVTSLLKVTVTPSQFDALVSFAYNVGSDIDQDDIPEGLGDSTLLKLVNANPLSPRIPGEFLKWNKSKGKVLDGLTKRRTIEAWLYRTGKLLIN
ncbi:MAG: lysozyme [Chitinophagaceae bacterium]|nr:MAG: lysozyme [Chitinophagaceae bacterium]